MGENCDFHGFDEDYLKKWKGILVISLKKMLETVHPQLEMSERSVLFMENLCLKLFWILMKKPTPKTVQELEHRIHHLFPPPIDRLTLKEARDQFEKGRKRSTLIFPLEKIHNLVHKDFFAHRIEFSFTIFLVAITEFLCMGLLKLAGNYVKNLEKSRIEVGDLRISMNADKALMDLFYSNDEFPAFPAENSPTFSVSPLFSNTNTLSTPTAANKNDSSVSTGSSTSCSSSCPTTGMLAEIKPVSLDHSGGIAVENTSIVDTMDGLLSYEDVVKELLGWEKQYLRDLEMCLWVFREELKNLGASQSDLAEIFGNFRDLYELTCTVCSNLDDVIEMAQGSHTPHVGTCFEELAEAEEFLPYLLYSQHLKLKFPQIAQKIEEIIDSSSEKCDHFSKMSLKFVLPQFLRKPIKHFVIFLDVLRNLREKTMSFEDRESLEQAEMMLRPFWAEFARHFPRTPTIFQIPTPQKQRRQAHEKLSELKRTIENFDFFEENLQEYFRDEILMKISFSNSIFHQKLTKNHQKFSKIVDNSNRTSDKSHKLMKLSEKTARNEDKIFRNEERLQRASKCSEKSLHMKNEEKIQYSDEKSNNILKYDDFSTNFDEKQTDSIKTEESLSKVDEKALKKHQNLTNFHQFSPNLVKFHQKSPNFSDFLRNSPKISERRAILFDNFLILVKNRQLKEKIVLKNSEIFDHLTEFGDFFEICGKNGEHSVFLGAKSKEEKEAWLADLVFLTNRQNLDRTLDQILAEIARKNPLKMPSPSLYRFAEADSPKNLILEERENGGVPLIKAATLTKLIERLTFHSFADPNFLKIFLTTFRSFCTPLEFFHLLEVRFAIPEFQSVENDEISGNDGNSSEKIKDSNEVVGVLRKDDWRRFKREFVQPVQFRVLNVLRHWVEHHFYDFELDPLLLKNLEDFLDNVQEKNMKKWVDSVRKILKRKLNTPHPLPLPLPPPNFIPSVYSNDQSAPPILLLRHASELARQLTQLHFDLYRPIRACELVGSVWTKKGKEERSRNLLRMIKMTTDFTLWLEKLLVTTENYEERCIVLLRIGDLMEKLEELNNFNGVLACVSALASASVHRLKFTFQSFPQQKQKLLDSYRIDDHLKNYQSKLRRVNPPCVPFLGCFLTSILHLEEGNPDFLTKSDNLMKKVRNMSNCDEKLENLSEIKDNVDKVSKREEKNYDTMKKRPNSTDLEEASQNFLENEANVAESLNKECKIDEKSGVDKIEKKDENEEKLVNFFKWRKIAEITGEIQQYQNQGYDFEVDWEIRHFFENLCPFDLEMNENDINNFLYQESQKIEPRYAKNPPKFPKKWTHFNFKNKKSPNLVDKSPNLFENRQSLAKIDEKSPNFDQKSPTLSEISPNYMDVSLVSSTTLESTVMHDSADKSSSSINFGEYSNNAEDFSIFANVKIGSLENSGPDSPRFRASKTSVIKNSPPQTPKFDAFFGTTHIVTTTTTPPPIPPRRQPSSPKQASPPLLPPRSHHSYSSSLDSSVPVSSNPPPPLPPRLNPNNFSITSTNAVNFQVTSSQLHLRRQRTASIRQRPTTSIEITPLLPPPPVTSSVTPKLPPKPSTPKNP